VKLARHHHAQLGRISGLGWSAGSREGCGRRHQAVWSRSGQRSRLL